MTQLEWADVARLGLGALRGAPADGVVRRVHADSREAQPGDLFVALNTGVRYVDDALARGAAALVPNDQHEALAALASLVRSRSDARVVAVVGSTGKTSTKDALGALCDAVTPTVFADASQNNEIGLPLTILRLTSGYQRAVLEMGFYVAGEVAFLCDIALPHVGVVSNVGTVHAERAGSQEAIARGKAELVQALPRRPKEWPC